MKAMFGADFCVTDSIELRHKAEVLNEIYFQVHQAFEIEEAPMLKGCFL